MCVTDAVTYFKQMLYWFWLHLCEISLSAERFQRQEMLSGSQTPTLSLLSQSGSRDLHPVNVLGLER